MKFFSKNTLYISVATITLVIGLFVVLPTAPSVDTAKDVFVNSTLAFGGGPGGDGEGPGNGNDGEGGDGCDCDDPGTDPDPDPTPGEGEPEDEPPRQPTMRTPVCTADGTEVTLSWSSVSDADLYPVRIREAGNSSTERAEDDVTGTSYTFSVEPGVEYEWWVHAFDGSNSPEAAKWSSYSRESFTCVAETPAPVCNLELSRTSVPNSGASVGIVWTSNDVANDSTLWIGDTEYTEVGVNSGARNIFVTEDTHIRFDIWNDTGFDTCEADITVEPPVVTTPAPVCDLQVSRNSVLSTGSVVTILWTSNDVANDSTLWIGDTEYTEVGINSGTRQVTLSEATKIRFDIWNDTGFDTCEADITVVPPVVNPGPSCDLFNLSTNSVPNGGGNVEVTWGTSNATDVRLNGSSVVADGSQTFFVNSATQFAITVDGQSTSCVANVSVEPPVTNPSPTCDLLTASSNTVPEQGGEVTLTWNTSNTSDVRLNGVPVVADGSTTTMVTTDTSFAITVDGQSTNCLEAVTVDTVTPPVFSCSELTFEANGSGSDITVNRGSTVNLEWAWTGNSNITSATVDQGIGTVGSGQTEPVVVDSTTTFTTTISNGSETRMCPITVNVQDTPNPNVFTCENNVTFTGNGTSGTVSLPRGGGDVDFNWNVTEADAISITNIGSVGASGSQTENVRSDLTYTLVANKAGFNQIECPVVVDVASGGGGGGGSSSPRCDLFEASDTRINAGEEITLEWETRRGDELTIYEGTERDGDEIFNTEDDDEIDEGSITVRPLRDTTYTLVVERGSRDRSCDVEVEIDNDVVVLSDRSQEPRVAGIALTTVPYTGFEAGTALTILFYTILTLWGLFVAYTLAIKGDSLLGFSFAGVLPRRKEVREVAAEPVVADEVTAPVSEAAAYVASEVVTPVNLPTGTMPVMGYATAETDTVVVADDLETTLENQAHSQFVLLSSDAMRFLIEQNSADTVATTLDAVMADAKKEYPTEDGWIVLNLERVQSLTGSVAAPVAVVPTTAGSLAEAIVDGNIVAAYEMIESRPMIALADAATDLDAAYRVRKGEAATVSDFLTTAVASLSDTQLESAIAALTGAIDGTYTDEASAVKMAIMKAVKAVN